VSSQARDGRPQPGAACLWAGLLTLSAFCCCPRLIQEDDEAIAAAAARADADEALRKRRLPCNCGATNCKNWLLLH
jgi:hypothetical protein